ncbi:hypothetical protein IWW54_001603 [Coemansia sp. RSA 2705]|nr:hypothetical protein IWW54_001603 [Coemansia sp. RSA 2705]
MQVEKSAFEVLMRVENGIWRAARLLFIRAERLSSQCPPAGCRMPDAMRCVANVREVGIQMARLPTEQSGQLCVAGKLRAGNCSTHRRNLLTMRLLITLHPRHAAGWLFPH